MDLWFILSLVLFGSAASRVFNSIDRFLSRIKHLHIEVSTNEQTEIKVTQSLEAEEQRKRLRK